MSNVTRINPLPLIEGRRISFVGKLGGINRKEARSLVREQGGVMVDRIDESVNVIVIGADQDPMEQVDDLLPDWVVEAVSEGQITIIDETQLWEQLGLVEETGQACRLYTPAMLAHLLQIPITTVRRWHRRGLIRPSRQVNRLPYFDFQEVSTARRIAGWIASGASEKAVESKLAKLAMLFPNLQHPLAQLSVIVEGRDILLRHGEGLVEPNGQMRIDFDQESASEVDGDSQSVVSFLDAVAESANPLDGLNSPSEFHTLAIDLEDSGDLESAAEVYRSMGLAFGPNAESSFRLAEILYQLGEPKAARERYYQAVELDSELVEARASLGCLLVELGQHELAISAFQGALEHHPDYPDVHFHLAELFDALDRSSEADQHWQEFLSLAPESPWAKQARDRLGLS